MSGHDHYDVQLSLHPVPPLDLTRYRIMEIRRPEPGEKYWWPVGAGNDYAAGPMEAGPVWATDLDPASDPLHMQWGRMIVEEIAYPKVELRLRDKRHIDEEEQYDLVVDGHAIWIDPRWKDGQEIAAARKLVDAYERLLNANR